MNPKTIVNLGGGCSGQLLVDLVGGAACWPWWKNMQASGSVICGLYLKTAVLVLCRPYLKTALKYSIPSHRMVKLLS